MFRQQVQKQFKRTIYGAQSLSQHRSSANYFKATAPRCFSSTQASKDENETATEQPTFRHNYRNQQEGRGSNTMARAASTMLIFGLSVAAFHYHMNDQSDHYKMAHAEARNGNVDPRDNIDRSADSPVYDSHEKQQQQEQAREVPTSPFEIPRLIAQREAEKRREYSERTKVDVRNIVNDKEAKKIRATDSDKNERRAPGDPSMLVSQDQISDSEEEIQMLMDQEEDEFDERGDDTLDELIKDPLGKKKEQMMLTPQEYRVITIGHKSILKEGQMIQVAISDPFDKNKFYPTDKIIVMKHKDKLYALGSYCGFDFTNLATGALLGEKLVCPTCCSSYDIKNGLVDIGPSMRNLSNFNINIREDEIKVTVPEHIPAFAKRKFLGRSKIDPRTFVVIGDSEAALSAIDALRTSFTGNIVCIPTSTYGQFENQDILKRKFTPLTKNETYMTDLDFLDRANITVIKGQVKAIDKDKKLVKIRGIKDVINFDKLLIAWGSYKKRLTQDYSNVFYLEDRYAHAKCHNEIIKAKKIVVLGHTMDAFQIASSVRSYLNDIGYNKTEVILMYEEESEIYKNMGHQVSACINDMLRAQGVTVIDNISKITQLEGDYKVDKIHFRKVDPAKHRPNQLNLGQNFFISPDMIIADDGVGRPKMDLKDLIGEEEDQGGLNSLTFNKQNIPISNVRFSLLQNDIMSPVLSAGSCTHYPSFMHKIKVRTDDIKYNIESGFYAAMNMLDKQVEFRYLPMTPLTIGDKKLYFVGEREQPITRVILRGKLGDEKWVAFFCYGDEICGFLTCGYQNLHIYLLEAMKHLLMPTAAMLTAADGNFDDIVNMVLRIRPDIETGRQYTVKTPSVIRAEFTREIEALNELRGKFRGNIRQEEEKVQRKLQRIKQKFDREGVEFVQNEDQIGRKAEDKPMAPSNIGPNPYGPPPMMPQRIKGHPSRNLPQSINLGGGSNEEVNPIRSVLQQSQSMFTPTKPRQ